MKRHELNEEKWKLSLPVRPSRPWPQSLGLHIGNPDLGGGMKANGAIVKCCVREA